MVQAETLVQDPEQVLEQRKPRASKKDAAAVNGAEGEEEVVNGHADESNGAAKRADPAAAEASAEAREQEQWRKR